MEGILKFWIFDRYSGFCIFEQTFEELPGNVNSDLIGGFMIAILSFAREIANEEIQFLQLKHIRISYHISEKYIICVATSNDTDVERTELALNAVHRKFDAQYHAIFEGGIVNDVSVFNNFAADLEHIFNAETKHLAYLRKRSEKIKQFLENGKDQWQNLQKMVSDQLKIFGDWKLTSLDEVDPKVKDQLIGGRSRAKAIMKQEAEKKSGQWKKKTD
jgi:hypothetical protein